MNAVPAEATIDMTRLIYFSKASVLAKSWTSMVWYQLKQPSLHTSKYHSLWTKVSLGAKTIEESSPLSLWASRVCHEFKRKVEQ